MCRVERIDDRPDDVGIPAFERVDFDVGPALVTCFVGRLDMQYEQVAIRERAQARVALRDIVVVESRGRTWYVDHLYTREYPKTLHEIDG